VKVGVSKIKNFPKCGDPIGIAWTPGEGLGIRATCINRHNPHSWMFVSGPGGIRTRDFFNAIDDQGGAKRKKAVYYV
jgi:hypothetical protein